MEAQTVTWLVFLALMKHVSTSDFTSPFKLEPGVLPATEGSCVEIKCNVTRDVDYPPSYWFWMKDAKWVNSDFTSTVIYSTNNSTRPVSPYFANKVKYIGSSSLSWKNANYAEPKPLCSVLICDLRRNDSGNYSLRFIGTGKWIWVTEVVTLNVTVNRCPLTFEGPAAVVESDKVTLTCNTSISCPSNPHIQDVTQNDQTQVTGSQQDNERTTFSFTASWEHDGRVFSCQTQDNKDKYLIRNITVTVKYKPRKPSISVSGSSDNQVKVGGSLTLTCDTDANPAPKTYSWSRSKNQQTDSWWKNTNSRELNLTIQRADEACYSCSSSNLIGRGDKSQPVCIQVLYPPTEPKLSMSSEVKEGQTITINCTAESFPQSTLTLMRINTNPQSSKITENNRYSRPINSLYNKINVTSADAGWYFCHALNTQGSKDSEQKELVVKYSPKHVTVQANQGLEVKENVSLTLSCSAESNPPVSSVTWRKTTDGREEIIQQTQTQTFRVNSASPSDSGLYSCEATNDIGSGKSQPAEVKVRFSPKHTKITKSAEKQELDGRSSVMLSCFSHSFPPVQHYSWYRKSQGEEKDKIVSEHQNHTVYSIQSGFYYCVAKNEEGQRLSDPVHLFEQNSLHILKFIVPALFVLMIIILIIVVLRFRKKKSIQQGTTNRTSLFLGWCNGTRRRSLTYENVSAEPFRSRDNLLSEQLRRQPLPDSTPPTDINIVYSLLNLPQAASAQNPTRRQDGNTEDDSVNYTSLHFKNKMKNKPRKVEDDTVYAKVSKPTRVKKNEPESLPDYENIGNAAARAPTSPNLLDDHSSEGEVELDYSQVSFTAMPRHQITNRDSSSSEEEESSYSDVRI
ncbi:B-cell receptor CD22 [Pleuronectes platessa]|uniref:B-cell receptor CD22 n=1 Tax=Pleuronectes platessa TaxID=8262 RepID=UPI00232A41A7|nr:B-cell receptor CD22 [Pleuronectes platessa]